MSTDTDEEAQSLLVASCVRGLDGEYYARELAHDQSLANLEAFALKLERNYERILESRGALKPTMTKKVRGKK